jgi:hypothetical protein
MVLWVGCVALQERKESAALELKTQLWNAEAELKQLKFKVWGGRP